MMVYECCEAIRIAYNQIGSGEQGYVPNAIAATIRVLNAVAADERVPAELREQAAYAAANLLIAQAEGRIAQYVRSDFKRLPTEQLDLALALLT